MRVYTRTLAAADVQALYLGTEPVLALPFDEAWAASGALLPDTSGWRRQATLNTGMSSFDGGNKAMAGQVGPYAVHFDGTYDYVSAGDVNETDAFGDCHHQPVVHARSAGGSWPVAETGPPR